ncbi:hypothetical protein F2P81_006563 [Scophthalmus maximus]|uniref:Vesicle transport protein GOT1B n=1 Tax=Scophthalmus maximus TaxID=52904 RepID=A0A6A4T689_SCOMX|nr:hypothetical protein F2P81_006563 [Scophthalmus maximus]
MLFFDKALLAIGNILFVTGLSFVIGLERTFRFFFQRQKVKATSFFLGGVLVVLIGWPIVGVVLEIYGFFLLFRGFFPVAVGFIRRVPVLGSLLSLPGISTGMLLLQSSHQSETPLKSLKEAKVEISIFLRLLFVELGIEYKASTEMCLHLPTSCHHIGLTQCRHHALTPVKKLLLPMKDLKISAMSLIVTLFVVTLVSQCWTTPQRRNWTPQAILYLKGAQGHRSVLERASRDKDDTLHLGQVLIVQFSVSLLCISAATHKQSSDGLGLSWASSLLLELVQLAMEEGGRKLDNYPNEEELNLNYF